MKKTILAITLFSALAGMSQASTVSLSKGLNPGFNVQAGGSTLTSFTMLIGAFDTAPVNPTAESIQALVQTTAFSEFGQAAAPANGLLTASVTKNDFSTGAAATAFNGKNIYVVVMDRATAALSGSFALLTVDTTSTAGTWVFPADVTSALVTTNASTGTLANFATLVGTEVDNATAPETLVLAAVPEPSATMLFAVVGALALGRRRR